MLGHKDTHTKHENKERKILKYIKVYREPRLYRKKSIYYFRASAKWARNCWSPLWSQRHWSLPLLNPPELPAHSGSSSSPSYPTKVTSGSVLPRDFPSQAALAAVDLPKSLDSSSLYMGHSNTGSLLQNQES